MKLETLYKKAVAAGIPVINVTNACATGSTAFREAYFAVGSGEVEVAMAVGSEQILTSVDGRTWQFLFQPLYPT